MNKEEIDKWLDEEYGCSYTRLEELHDFYFEKYIDLRGENKQLKDVIDEVREYIKEHSNNETEYLDVWEVPELLQILDKGESNE